MKTKQKTQVSLQNQLVVSHYLHHLISPDLSQEELKESLYAVDEGVDVDNISHFCKFLCSQIKSGLSSTELVRYDSNIQKHLGKINRNRFQNSINLRYYQYLALLFTEVHLDCYFRDRQSYCLEINDFAQRSEIDYPTVFCNRHQNDLNKVAYWMATGSGKTVIMHINYWQYIHYCGQRNQPENILLITPNEGLSLQHKKQFDQSQITCRRFGNSNLQTYTGVIPVDYLEITKLTEKKGGKRTFSVSLFEDGDSQLLLVDEGHRGSNGDKWKRIRNKLGKSGFTFEYSATFGQVVGRGNKKKKEELLDEYSKAILFDYSYPHFHRDGYGKDYWVLNVDKQTQHSTDTIMLANLLTFYEQKIVYASSLNEMERFNIENPLWVFVGTTVTGGKSKKNTQTITDIQNIILFFDNFLMNGTYWINQIELLLSMDKDSPFSGLFSYIKNQKLSPVEIYEHVIKTVFHAQRGEPLRIVEMKGISKEIGLQVGPTNPYFGIIRVSSTNTLVHTLKENHQLTTSEEHMRQTSLFNDINNRDSSVNVLVGSKMFVEGWDCYRVSCMGLLNIGRGEGPQIIQLFGRGVRLRGYKRSLKRSSFIESDSPPPKNVELLETLRIFGIRADYMVQFRNAIESAAIIVKSEPIIAKPKQDLSDRVKLNQLLRRRFLLEHVVTINPNSERIVYDARPNFRNQYVQDESTIDSNENRIDQLRACSTYFDWQSIYLDLVVFAEKKEMGNSVFNQRLLKDVFFSPESLVLYCSPSQIVPFDPNDRNRFPAQEVVTTLLKMYLDTQYKNENRDWINSLKQNEPFLFQ